MATRTPQLLPAEAVLRDGASIVIRNVSPEDRDQLTALVGRMSPTSLHHRYCGAKRELTEQELSFLTSPDGVTHVALAAVACDRLIGVGRYIREGKESAELAFDVGDADQGRGIGTVLLEHLARMARAAGVTTFRAIVEADNAQMLDVFEHSGFAVHATVNAGVYEIEFATADTERFVAASAERERQAAVRARQGREHRDASH